MSNKVATRTLGHPQKKIELSIQFIRQKRDARLHGVKTGNKKTTDHWLLILFKGNHYPGGQPAPGSEFQHWQRKGRITLPRMKALKKWLAKHDIEDLFPKVLDEMMSLI